MLVELSVMEQRYQAVMAVLVVFRLTLDREGLVLRPFATQGGARWARRGLASFARRLSPLAPG